MDRPMRHRSPKVRMAPEKKAFILATIALLCLFGGAYARGYRFERQIEQNKVTVSYGENELSVRSDQGKRTRFYSVSTQLILGDEQIQNVISSHPVFPRYGLFIQPNAEVMVAVITNKGRKVVLAIGRDGYKELPPELYFRKGEMGWR